MQKRLLAAVVASVLAPSITYAGIYGILKGKVLDDQGKPVGKASVSVIGTKQGAITKSDGSFTILQVNPGTYTLKVTFMGKTPAEKSVQVSADQTVEVNFTMKEKVTETGPVLVVDDKLVDAKNIGTVQKVDSELLKNAPRETVAGVLATRAGVQTAGSGFNIRGARSTETQFRIDGLDVGDQFSGGFGGTPTNYFPTVSNFATQEVQVISGAFSAEYGNALGGIVNTVTRSGRNDRYEGYIRFRSDAPDLYGSANNGIKAMGAIDQSYDLGIGGPITEDITFFVSSRYNTQKYRNNAIGVIDPGGNNLGALPNNGLWVRNATGTIRWALSSETRFEVSGTYGISSWENSSWAWIYSNDLGLLYDGTVLNAPERVAKQPVTNQWLTQIRGRITHNLTDQSLIEATFSYTSNRNETGKRLLRPGTMIEGPSLAGGFELWEPIDAGMPDPNGNIISAQDKVLDQYFSYIGGNSATVDGSALLDRRQRNPLTGYVEGGSDARSTRNAYGIIGFFNLHGNERDFEFRSSEYFQFDGNYQSLFKTGDKINHTLKAGYEGRVYTLRRHQNSLPWESNAFFDVYTDEWGGNIYAPNDEIRELTSKPYRPFDLGIYVQDQIEYEKLILSVGLRADYLDPNAVYRTVLSPFQPIQNIDAPGIFTDAESKLRISPRINIAFPVTDRSVLSLAYGVMFQRPQYNNFYDGFNTSLLRGNQIIGNPDLTPQNVRAYEAKYSSQLTDDFAIDATVYYRDLYNQVGLSYIPGVPSGYSIYSVAEYGNTRGLELSLRKRPTNNFGFEITYTLASARGTASGPESNYSLVTLAGVDEFTRQQRVFPLTDYYLDFDRRHRINTVLNFVWADGEGPSIAGVKILENTIINFTGFYQTGTPYTRLDIRGVQIGEYNGERQPDVWRLDSRIQKDFLLRDIFGEGLSNSRITLFVDVVNIFNNTNPVANFARTGNPDNDGQSLFRQLGDFPGVTYFREADDLNPVSRASFQYDTYGNRLYNEAADFNGDGAVTQEETYRSYQNFVEDAIARRGNYQFPRQVFFGFMFQF